MRLILLTFTVAGTITGIMGQALTEFGAAASGGTVGGAAGKKVSDGLTNILDKVDQRTSAAASTAAPKAVAPARPAAPLLDVSPGVVGTALPASAPKAAPKAPVTRASVNDSVPAPPPLPGEMMRRPEPPKIQRPVPVVVVAPPPPPPVTPEDLRGITLGESRGDVLKLGAPASRISMFDDGHFLEIYRYMSGDVTFGVVRVSDGAVSKVDVK